MYHLGEIQVSSWGNTSIILEKYMYHLGEIRVKNGGADSELNHGSEQTTNSEQI